MRIEPDVYVIISVASSDGQHIARFLIRRSQPPSFVARSCEEALMRAPTAISTQWEMWAAADGCKYEAGDFNGIKDGAVFQVHQGERLAI